MKPTYQLDQMVSGQWVRFKTYQHTVQGMAEAFRQGDILASSRFDYRVIDTGTGTKLLEVTHGVA